MNGDVTTVLAGELHQLASDFASRAAALNTGSEDAATECLALCERLGQVAQMIEVPALQEVAMFLMSNIPSLMTGEANTHAPAELCANLELCLLEGTGSSRWATLANEFADARWPCAFELDAANDIAVGLKSLSEIVADQREAPRVVTADDLSLTAGTDVGDETLRAFYEEAPRQASQLSAMLARMKQTASVDELPAMQRLVHTVKGSASLVGFTAIAHLAHALETALQAVAAQPGELDAMLEVSFEARVEALIEAGDMIELLIEHAADSSEIPAERVGELLGLIQKLYALNSDADDATAVGVNATDNVESVVHVDAELVVQPVAEPVVAMPAVAAAPPAVDSNNGKISDGTATEKREASSQQHDPVLSVPVALIDDNMRRAGELNIEIGQLAAQLNDSMSCAERLAQQLQRVQAQVYELETMVDTRGVRATRLAPSGGDAGANTNTNTGDRNFDPLEFDEYTELHSLSRAFSESALDSRELSRELSEELLQLQNLLSQHARLGRDLSDSIMGARLVPVASIVPRLERIVRQTARHTGRNVELTIEGRDLSIDTDILNGMVEPLMHALRNAIDHGIETPDARSAAGKSPQGRIHLKFSREGNRIEVVCRDDGRGLDFDSITARGVERGLIQPGAQPVESELIQLIFVQGFSTRQDVSAISGRGVGMDVVRASIERLKGTVHMESQRGAGCTLTFRLPLSLTAVHALFVAVEDDVYGLPSTTIEQLLFSDAGQIVRIGDRFAFEHGDRVAPLYSLAGLLGVSSTPLEQLDEQPKPIVLVRGDQGLVALAVDKALDSRQIVIKGLSALLPAQPGIAGASVLPDGGIGVVLEVRELLRAQTGRNVVNFSSVIAKANAATTDTAARALVVDDSLSARRTLAQLLSDVGYTVVTAIDGADALAQIEREPPALLLVDMEMPRMNGLELTTHLRANPAFNRLPIVMITSRAADKHRAQALRAGVTAYVTKPYLEHDLLDQLYALAPPYSEAQRRVG